VRRVEQWNLAEVRHVYCGPAARSQHERYALPYRLPKSGFIYARELHEIVLQVVLHQNARRRVQRRRQAFAAVDVEAVFEAFHNVRHKFRLHLPNGHGPGRPAPMRIRDVEVILQPGPVGGAVEHGNACAAPVHPAAKLLVPAFNFKNGGRVRALGIDQELFIKGEFVVPGGGL